MIWVQVFQGNILHAVYWASILTLILVSSPGMGEEEGAGEGEGTRSPAGAIELPVIEVIATTPLPALGTPLDKVPANVQSLTAEDVEEQNPLDLSEMLFDNIGSVNINAAQNNPFQNDLEYRGFLASPLVGSAIGLSLYMDGVRINEGFGDTVNWDLIPQSAISSVDLIPGSNPLFGLNTLGGAIALRTKGGFVYQGTEVEGSGGSFGRWRSRPTRGYHGGFDRYLTFNALMRTAGATSPRARSGNCSGRSGGKTIKPISITLYLRGQRPDRQWLRPRDLLAGIAHGPYLSGQHRQPPAFPESPGQPCFTDALLLAGNAYYRGYQRDTLNGDAEVQCVDEDDSEIALAAGAIRRIGRALRRHR